MMFQPTNSSLFLLLGVHVPSCFCLLCDDKTKACLTWFANVCMSRCIPEWEGTVQYKNTHTISQDRKRGGWASLFSSQTQFSSSRSFPAWPLSLLRCGVLSLVLSFDMLRNMQYHDIIQHGCLSEALRRLHDLHYSTSAFMPVLYGWTEFAGSCRGTKVTCCCHRSWIPRFSTC